MVRHPLRKRTRKQKLICDAVILLLCVPLLIAVLDFPIPTAELAFRSAEARHFFGRGEIVLDVNPDALGKDAQELYLNRAFVSRRGNWFAYAEVRRELLFWQPSGGLTALEHDPSKPLELLAAKLWAGRWLLVACDLPEAVSAEVTYPANDGGWHLNTRRETAAGQGCFFFALDEVWQNRYGPEEVRLRCYDAAGNLIYETPTPAVWSGESGISQ